MPAENLTVTAQWSIKTYTITWKNDDGTTIDTTTVEHGTVPTHDAVTKAATAEYTYTFKGWTPEPVAATANAEYTAEFTATANEYTITFVTGDGASTVAPMTVAYGAQVTAPAAPTREGYTFTGWDPALPATMPAENLTVTAQWSIKTYTITWKNWNGDVLETDNDVAYGATPEFNKATPTRPATEGHTYTFAGWNDGSVTYAVGADLPAVTGDVTYTAQFIEENTYVISGSVKAFGDETVPVAISIMINGKETPAEVGQGNETSFSIANVPAGTYTLTVSKTNHAPREYTVIVGDANVTQNVEIHLMGDLNGDGKVTTFDAARANSHARKVSLLEGYDLIVADVLGPNGEPDGQVTTADAGRINSHARKIRPLW